MKPGLLRFVLASIVIFFHITSFVYIGTMAVYCFFILSGYWIAYMYEKKYSKTVQPLFVFYVSRVVRLFPVYYLFTVLAILFTCIYKPENMSHLDPVFWLSNIFMLGYNELSYRFITPAWSLDIELQFYILCPLILWIAAKKNPRIILLILSLFTTLVLTIEFPISIASKSVLQYLLYFVVGIEIYKDKISFSERTEWLFTCLFLVILLLHYLIPELNFLIRSPNYGRYFNQFGCFLLIPLICNSVLKKGGNSDRLLGNSSYVLYLSHWIWLMPYNYYIIGASKTARIPFIATFLIVTYGMTYIIYTYYDKPIDNMRRNWVERNLRKKGS